MLCSGHLQWYEALTLEDMLIQHIQHFCVHAMNHQPLTQCIIFTGVVVVFLFSYREGRLNIVEYIVQQDASTTENKNGKGETPLHNACE